MITKSRDERKTREKKNELFFSVWQNKHVACTRIQLRRDLCGTDDRHQQWNKKEEEEEEEGINEYSRENDIEKNVEFIEAVPVWEQMAYRDIAQLAFTISNHLRFFRMTEFVRLPTQAQASGTQ